MSAVWSDLEDGAETQREATKAQAAPYKGGDDLKTLDPGK